MCRLVLIALVAAILVLSSVVEETNGQYGWGWPYSSYYGYGYGWPYSYGMWGKRSAGFGSSENDAAQQKKFLAEENAGGQSSRLSL
ncbi:hypothetical protein Ddc_18547 [Ditylenchus destructor]|nr:hypothetical protein Ddc_18547 [Ditylenchus destructor]